MKEKLIIQTLIELSVQIVGLYVTYLKTRPIIEGGLGTIGYGILSYATSLNGLFSVFTDLGINTIHYQYTYKSDLSKYFGSYFVIKLVLLLSNYAFAFVWLVFQNNDSLTLQVIFLFFLNGLIYSIGDLFNMNLQVRLKLIKKEIVIFSIQMLNYALQSYILFHNTDVNTAVLEISLVILYTSCAQVIFFILISLKENIFVRPSFMLIKEYFKSAKPLVIQQVINGVTAYIGSVLIGNENLSLLAYYTLTMSILNIFSTASASFTKLFDSTFPKLFLNKEKSAITEISYVFEEYASIIYIFIIFAINLFVGPLIMHFIPDYQPSIVLLDVMIFLPYFATINIPFSNNLVQNKRQKMMAQINLIEGISTLLIQLIFIPANLFSIPMLGWGPWGMIFEFILFTIVNTILFRYLSNKLFSNRSRVKHLKHFLIGFITYFLVYAVSLVTNRLIANFFVNLTLLFLLLVGIYLALLFFTRELKKQDIVFLLDLLKPKNYVDSFKDEMKQ
jgi:O-antigen/teichoic acid export membrane protein